MTTASPELGALRRHREAERDLGTNAGDPPGRGANSTVSHEALLRVAQSGPGAAQSGGPTLSGDLARNVQAATLPPVTQTQARPGADAGERPQTGQPQRGTGKDGHIR